MKNEIDIVHDISDKFAEAGIPFMLTGSMAMNYYARPRMTRDIDVVVELEPMDVDKIARAFGEDYTVAPEAVLDSIIHTSSFNIIHKESVIKVDCIVRKNDEYRITEFKRRRKIKISKFSTYIASKEDLIISKLLWAKDSHSQVQMNDVRNLLAAGYDSDYLKKWTDKLGVKTLFSECLHE